MPTPLAASSRLAHQALTFAIPLPASRTLRHSLTSHVSHFQPDATFRYQQGIASGRTLHSSTISLAKKRAPSKRPPTTVHEQSSSQTQAPRQGQANARYQTPRSQDLSSFDEQPRKAPFPFVWALSGTVFIIVATFTWIRIRRMEEEYAGSSLSEGEVEAEDSSLSALKDPSARYHSTAETFDSDIDSWEKWSGIKRKRRRLVRRADGHVLEVSSGTGRNFDYYDLNRCKSITFLDQAAEMTHVAHEKYEQAAKDGRRFYKKARFVTQSALDAIDAPPGGFDTVVQTFGLCSTGDPVSMLKRMADVLNPDTGKILLLEHGKGTFGFVNRLLNKSASSHAAKFGCWWNRDIARIVRESGLEIVSEKRYLLHLGTTYWYELRPAKGKEAAKGTEGA